MLSKVKTGVRALLGNASDASAATPSDPRVPANERDVLTYDSANDTPCPRGPILKLDECPVCGGSESTHVSRYNRFILFDRVPDRAAAIYAYSLCHACGVVYAQRRPAGERYHWLLERFEETLGRAEVGAPRPGKFALSSSSLTDEARERLRQLAANGVF